MELFFQLLLNGIWAGSIYAILGVSWGLIFAATRTFHFAHGATFVIAAYFTYLISNLGLGLALASMVGVAAAVSFGMIIEGVLYRWLRRVYATQLVVFIASLGSLIFVENAIGMFFGSDAKALSGFPIKSIKIGSVGFTSLYVAMFVTSALLLASLMFFLSRTTSGRAIRAVISNPEMAEVIGIDTDRVYLIVYAIGSALVAVGAILVTLDRGASPELGTWAILYAFIPVIIGGVGSIPGAALGGLIIGMAESIGIWKISSQWQLGIAFVVLLLVLILRPSGLFGFRVYRGKI
jgi:branched-chain amino acid transport system permease protein